MNTLDFVKSDKMTNDFIAKMNQMKNQEEVYELLKREGLTDSYEVFVAEASKLRDVTEKMSDKEMESFVGGSNITTTTTTTTTTATPAFGAIAA